MGRKERLKIAINESKEGTGRVRGGNICSPLNGGNPTQKQIRMVDLPLARIIVSRRINFQNNTAYDVDPR